MATPAIEVPPSNRIVPGSHHLTPFAWPKPADVAGKDPEQVAITWVSSFNDLVSSKEYDVSGFFLKDSYWRDLLCLTWDFHTLHGLAEITSLVQDKARHWRIKSLGIDRSSDVGKPTISPVDVAGIVKGVQSFLTVETDVGRGRGVVRLLPDPDDGGKWKVFSLFTTLQELTGFEESTGKQRPTGVEHGANINRKNWKERREAEVNFEGEREPAVLILGAGQGGLTTAARLKQLGVETLLVEKNPRVGDNWRNRYHQLVLHDTVWYGIASHGWRDATLMEYDRYDHMPYLNFPPNWPVFTAKDKLADWLEFYANALELNVWTSTSIKESKWDENNQKWNVEVERLKDGKKETRIFNPRHIVQATGHAGSPYIPADIKGIHDFKGNRLVHSAHYTTPEANGKGKKAVIVGCSNSALDIAQDYYEHGYDVTIVQRSSTLVISSKTIVDVLLSGLYNEGGLPVEEADLMNMSIPNPIAKRFHIEAAQESTRRDAQLLRGLVDAGFAVDNGPDCGGLLMKYLHRGGGYYIDVGASQLIADRKIKIKHGQEISRINPHSITFSDDSELGADEIVLATGYTNMRDTAREFFGDELADRVGDVWGFDEEGEVRTMWRRSGHPGFWFFGGNLAFCRFFSRMLALQIKALEEGIAKYEDA